jgi:hypothetical protein
VPRLTYPFMLRVVVAGGCLEPYAAAY